MSKKKKLKKRHGGVSVGGNSQTVSNILAQVKTVKAEYEKPTDNAVDLDNWGNSEMEEPDDLNAITSQDIAATSAPENVGNSEQQSATVTWPTTNLQSPFELQSQSEGVVPESAVVQSEILNNSNMLNQQISTQEKEKMNVVNHPQAQQSPIVTPAGVAPVSQVAQAPVTETNIVAESVMEQMQHDANTAPPVPQSVNPNEEIAPEVVAPVKAKPTSAFHSIAMTVIFTLDMTNFTHMTDLKKALTRVDIDGQDFNLYSPFRKAGKKAEQNPSAEGIVRYALSGILDLTDTINNSRVMFVGKESEVQASLENAIEQTRNQIINLFPCDFETTIAEITDVENQQTIQLQLKDIVNIRSWTNSSTPSDEDEVEAVAVHNAVINVTVNAGMLYDTEDRLKYLSQVENVLTLVNNNREEANTTLLLAVNMDSSSLSDAAMRQLLDAMLSSEQFILYTRQEMYRQDVSDFLPQSKESIDNDLLTPNGDLLLIRLLTQDEDEEDAEGSDAAEGAVEK